MSCIRAQDFVAVSNWPHGGGSRGRNVKKLSHIHSQGQREMDACVCSASGPPDPENTVAYTGQAIPVLFRQSSADMSGGQPDPISTR